MANNSEGQMLGGVVGAMIGSRFGWIGAGVGALVGMVASQAIQVPRQRSTTVNPSRRPAGTTRTHSTRQTVDVSSPTTDDGSYNICPKCNTANEATLLLCEFCGERMPVKRG